MQLYRRLALIAVSTLFAACSHHATASADHTTTTGHICVGERSAPPLPRMTYEVAGQSGNEWTLPVTSSGVTLNVRVSQRANTTIKKLDFQLTPEGASSDHVIRRLAVDESWKPGVHSIKVRWDGRDSRGDRVPPGRYHLFAATTGSELRAVLCADGSGSGVERLGGTDGAGLGFFSVS